MSDPIDVLIQAAFMNQLKTPDLTSPVTPIAWPLVAYNPVVNTPYLEVHPILRADVNSPGLAFGGSNIFAGVLQIDSVYPDGKGEAAALRLASLVVARFPQGLKLVAGTRKLLVTRTPSIAAAVLDAPWVRFPVSIPYTLINR